MQASQCREKLQTPPQNMLRLRLPDALAFALPPALHLENLLEVVTLNSLPHYHRSQELGCAPADEHGQVWVSWDHFADGDFLEANLRHGGRTIFF